VICLTELTATIMPAFYKFSCLCFYISFSYLQYLLLSSFNEQWATITDAGVFFPKSLVASVIGRRDKNTGCRTFV
jgi:hypothetical protein